MRRIGLFSCASFAAAALMAPAAAAREASPQSKAATCEAPRVNPESYRLTTDAQALNVLRPRGPWWEPYGVWTEPREIGDLNQGAVRLAERARELDDGNLLAHGYLARQYIVMAVDATKAEDEWNRVLDNGGAITWTATLYDVDPRSVFVVAFDRKSLRLFRFGGIAGKVRTHFGVPEFPGAEGADLWRALGGCLPAGAVPDAEIPWTDVRDVHATRWTLRLDLDRKVTVISDRGNRRTDDVLEINLHGQTGDVDFRYGMTPFVRRPFGSRPPGPDPAAYQERVRQFLTKFFLGGRTQANLAS